MRVLLVAHGWPLAEMGGVGLYVRALAQELGRQGEEVAVLAPGGRGEELEERQEEWGTALLAPSIAPRRWSETWRKPRLLSQLAAWAGSWRPDVAHVHHLSGIGLDIWEALPEDTLRALSLHDYSVPCARGQLWNPGEGICSGPGPARCAGCISAQFHLNPLSARLGRWLRRTPRLRSGIRSALDKKSPGRRDARRVGARLGAAKALMEQSDLLLSPSRDLKRRMEAMGWPMPEHCDLPLLEPVHPGPSPKGPREGGASSCLARGRWKHLRRP